MPLQRFHAIPACPAAGPAAPAGEPATPRTWLPTAGVVALAGEANGSDAAAAAQIAMRVSGTLRILAPEPWDAPRSRALTCP